MSHDRKRKSTQAIRPLDRAKCDMGRHQMGRRFFDDDVRWSSVVAGIPSESRRLVLACGFVWHWHPTRFDRLIFATQTACAPADFNSAADTKAQNYLRALRHSFDSRGKCS